MSDWTHDYFSSQESRQQHYKTSLAQTIEELKRIQVQLALLDSKQAEKISRTMKRILKYEKRIIEIESKKDGSGKTLLDAKSIGEAKDLLGKAKSSCLKTSSYFLTAFPEVDFKTFTRSRWRGSTGWLIPRFRLIAADLNLEKGSIDKCRNNYRQVCEEINNLLEKIVQEGKLSAENQNLLNQKIESYLKLTELFQIFESATEKETTTTLIQSLKKDASLKIPFGLSRRDLQSLRSFAETLSKYKAEATVFLKAPKPSSDIDTTTGSLQGIEEIDTTTGSLQGIEEIDTTTGSLQRIKEIEQLKDKLSTLKTSLTRSLNLDSETNTSTSETNTSTSETNTSTRPDTFLIEQIKALDQALSTERTRLVNLHEEFGIFINQRWQERITVRMKQKAIDLVSNNVKEKLYKQLQEIILQELQQIGIDPEKEQSAPLIQEYWERWINSKTLPPDILAQVLGPIEPEKFNTLANFLLKESNQSIQTTTQELKEATKKSYLNHYLLDCISRGIDEAEIISSVKEKFLENFQGNTQQIEEKTKKILSDYKKTKQLSELEKEANKLKTKNEMNALSIKLATEKLEDWEIKELLSPLDLTEEQIREILEIYIPKETLKEKLKASDKPNDILLNYERIEPTLKRKPAETDRGRKNIIQTISSTFSSVSLTEQREQIGARFVTLYNSYTTLTENEGLIQDSKKREAFGKLLEDLRNLWSDFEKIPDDGSPQYSTLNEKIRDLILRSIKKSNKLNTSQIENKELKKFNESISKSFEYLLKKAQRFEISKRACEDLVSETEQILLETEDWIEEQLRCLRQNLTSEKDTQLFTREMTEKLKNRFKEINNNIKLIKGSKYIAESKIEGITIQASIKERETLDRISHDVTIAQKQGEISDLLSVLELYTQGNPPTFKYVTINNPTENGDRSSTHIANPTIQKKREIIAQFDKTKTNALRLLEKLENHEYNQNLEQALDKISELRRKELASLESEKEKSILLLAKKSTEDVQRATLSTIIENRQRKRLEWFLGIERTDFQPALVKAAEEKRANKIEKFLRESNQSTKHKISKKIEDEVNNFLIERNYTEHPLFKDFKKWAYKKIYSEAKDLYILDEKRSQTIHRNLEAAINSGPLESPIESIAIECGQKPKQVIQDFKHFLSQKQYEEMERKAGSQLSELTIEGGGNHWKEFATRILYPSTITSRPNKKEELINNPPKDINERINSLAELAPNRFITPDVRKMKEEILKDFTREQIRILNEAGLTLPSTCPAQTVYDLTLEITRAANNPNIKQPVISALNSQMRKKVEKWLKDLGITNFQATEAQYFTIATETLEPYCREIGINLTLTEIVEITRLILIELNPDYPLTQIPLSEKEIKSLSMPFISQKVRGLIVEEGFNPAILQQDLGLTHEQSTKLERCHISLAKSKSAIQNAESEYENYEEMLEDILEREKITLGLE